MVLNSAKAAVSQPLGFTWNPLRSPTQFSFCPNILKETIRGQSPGSVTRNVKRSAASVSKTSRESSMRAPDSGFRPNRPRNKSTSLICAAVPSAKTMGVFSKAACAGKRRLTFAAELAVHALEEFRFGCFLQSLQHHCPAWPGVRQMTSGSPGLLCSCLFSRAPRRPAQQALAPRLKLLADPLCTAATERNLSMIFRNSG